MRLALNPCAVFGRVEACRPCTVLWGAPLAEALGGGLSTRNSWRPLSGQKAQPRVSRQEPRCTRGSPLTAAATGHPGLAHWTRAQAGAGGGGPQRGAAEGPPLLLSRSKAEGAPGQGRGGESADGGSGSAARTGVHLGVSSACWDVDSFGETAKRERPASPSRVCGFPIFPSLPYPPPHPSPAPHPRRQCFQSVPVWLRWLRKL